MLTLMHKFDPLLHWLVHYNLSTLLLLQEPYNKPQMRKYVVAIRFAQLE